MEKKVILTLLFLFPTQLAYHFWPSWAFVFGMRVDLLSPTVYLTDVLIALLLLLKVFRDRQFFKPLTKYKTFLAAFFILAITNCIFSTSIPLSIYKWVKVLEFFFLTFYFARQQIVALSQIVKVLFYSLTTFSLIGIFQFIKGGTIGGALYYLGERSFNQSTPGIALVSLMGAEHLRAYSTFSHPNSLAGFLGAAILFILLSGKLKKSMFNLILVLIILICFVLTFSISAYLGIFFAFAFYLFSKNRKTFKLMVVTSFFISIVGSLLMPIFSPRVIQIVPKVAQNIGQRLDLAYIAGKMISQRFLLGEGLGTFVVNIPAFKGIFSYLWLLQPVHNIFLLVFSETGIFGILLFCLIIYKTLARQLQNKQIYLLLPLIFIVFTGLFDHYTLTLQQNTLLFSLLIGLSLR